MDKKNEFYVGWQDQMPAGNKSFIKRIIIAIFLAIPLLALVMVKLQKPFNAHKFELGKVKAFTGTYIAKPLPMLVVGADDVPAGFASSILLVGYGKFGAEGIMQEIEETAGELNGKNITLKGTLIYGDGKVLVELTDRESSLVKINDHTVSATTSLAVRKRVKLSGEILDPKCYFGVMKPGEGKIHKSCAIRCISGGIPAVFRQSTGDNQNPYQYYLLLGEEGDKINKQLLPFIAGHISIEGEASRIVDWDILYLGSDQLQSIDK
jgi:hypothetical protein